MEVDDYKQLYEDILNHKDNLVNLYTLFMRNQVLKKDWVKKDYKFSIFSDLSIGETEIENCSQIIDFTKCSYSIDNLNKIHLLIENYNKKLQLVQYYIKEEELSQS